MNWTTSTLMTKYFIRPRVAKNNHQKITMIMVMNILTKYTVKSIIMKMMMIMIMELEIIDTFRRSLTKRIAQIRARLLKNNYPVSSLHRSRKENNENGFVIFVSMR